MESKLEFMQRTLNELDVALTDVTTKALHVADELELNVDDDAGPFEVIQELRKQVHIGQEYTKPFVSKCSPEEHATLPASQIHIVERRQKP